MIPVLFKLGPLTIHSFGFMLAVAFILLASISSREFVRRGYSADAAASVVLGAMIGGVLGAKLYFLLDHWPETAADPRHMIFSGAGLTYYGGFLGGLLGVALAGHRHRIRFPHLADICAPLLALGYAVGRVGCFLNGDDYGKVTESVFGMTFPKGTPPTTVPVHPTQVYETASSLLIFAFLWINRKRWEIRPGTLIGVYLVLGGTERFLVEYLRTNVAVAFGLTVAQWISLSLVLAGFAVLAAVSSRSRVRSGDTAGG